MFKIFCFFTISGFIQPIFAAEKESASPLCQLSFVTRSDLSQFKADGQPIGTLSQSVNKILKKSFDLANALDHYTLGLASAITLSTLLNRSVSLEDIKPNAWNQVTLNGALVYKDSPFTVMPVRAAKIKIKFEKKSETLSTGAHGEYSGYFYKWITYNRFRLFPNPIFERKQKLIKTLDVPFEIEIESKICHGATTLTTLPLEPITFILSPIDEQKSLD